MTSRCTQLPFLVAALAMPSCGGDYAYKPPPPVIPECVAERTLSSAAGLRVDGNRILDPTGKEVRFRGINRAGSEYKCVMGESIFDGPVDDAAILAMVSWNVNVVRIPLNEDCWLGINGVEDAYSGATYQNEIAGFVDRLHGHGLYAIVELHWNAPGANLAHNQQPMPDADHSPAFWSSVANRFKGDPKVIFDLHNEPFPTGNTDMTMSMNTRRANTNADPWACWRDGCTITASEGITQPWQAAGMQTLMDAVRATGAEQIVMLGGLNYANDLTGWKTHRPHDALCNTAVSYHQYDMGCTTEPCWDYFNNDIAATLPFITGEVGETDCQHDFIDRYMTWADAHKVSYLAWAWNTSNCSSFPSLIRRYDGTPTAFGIGYRDHLLTTSP